MTTDFNCGHPTAYALDLSPTALPLSPLQDQNCVACRSEQFAWYSRDAWWGQYFGRGLPWDSNKIKCLGLQWPWPQGMRVRRTEEGLVING